MPRCAGILGLLGLLIGAPVAAAPRPAAGRIHLLDIAKKLTYPTHPIYRAERLFAEYFHQPKTRLTRAPPLAEHPSAFETGLRQHWRPDQLKLSGPLFERTGPLPAASPWAKQVRSRSVFTETGFFRGAVINTVARWADQKGWVDLATLRKQFGGSEHEQVILQMLEEPGTLRPGTSWKSVLEHLDRETLHKMAPRLTRGLIPRDMPALKWVRRTYDPGRRLAGIRRVWAKQHVLGNTHGFLNATGLQPERVDIWGKVYSFDPRAAVGMESDGYRVHGDSVHRSRRQIERQIAEELRAIPHPEQHHKPIFMLLDDGGELIEIAAEFVKKNFPRHAHLFAGVEQTQGGVNRINKRFDDGRALPFRVVTSGSSWGKKEYGSAMFGYAIGKATTDILDQYARRIARFGEASSRTVTVLGYGPVGQVVARYFHERGHAVTVYDKDPAKRALARAHGFKAPAKKAAALADGQILVSCVGRPAFRHSSFWHVPPGAVVVNGGSVNDLPRVGTKRRGLPKLTEDAYGSGVLVERAFIRPDPENPEEELTRGFAFAKDGGVINFPNSATDPRAGRLIPGRYIQFQLGLLYLDLLHAAEGGKPGIGETPRPQQEALVKMVQADLGKRGESLLDPRWK